MKWLWIYLAFSLACCSSLTGQSSENLWVPSSWAIGYVGEKATHPGLFFQINWLNKASPSSDKLIHQWSPGLVASTYLHPRNHLGTRITPQLHYQMTFPTGWEIGMLADAGYMRRWYHGRVFSPQPDGNFQRIRFAGQHALTYGAYLQVGRRFIASTRSWSWFFRPGVFWEFPYQGYALFHPSLHLGILQHFSS